LCDQIKLMSQYRVQEYRIYEGEWWFYCLTQGCQGSLVEYSLNDYENYADNFLNNSCTHSYDGCHLCGQSVEWGGYSGGSPISNSLVALLKNKHYMASTVILSAIIDNSLENLLWAALVDSGVDKESANKIADGRLNRKDIIKIATSLSSLKIKDITFASRNLVAHGKGFSRNEESYRIDLQEQIIQIRKWVEQILDGKTPNNFMPTECERWLLFMDHWSRWLVNYVDIQLLSK
jgi:hypothetical protein